MPRVPAVLGAALILAIEKNCDQLLNYLWGDDFIHIWRVSHLKLTLDVLSEKEKVHAL
jgi:hypothetical protein